MLRIRQYLATKQKDVYLEWLKKVRDPLAKGQLIRRVSRLADGNFGDHKFCRDGVWELRIDQGTRYSVYYAMDSGVVVLLLCGGDKGTQSADIERAVGYWKDWQQRIEP
ncbi:MAG: type II toxin-antitoxin system RelE/ParE family toxin [Polaromonas sp.]|nr:type II toxin-antitoxin system RelE/ParE family toxin [Polaromonas sp.]